MGKLLQIILLIMFADLDHRQQCTALVGNMKIEPFAMIVNTSSAKAHVLGEVSQ